MKRWLPWIVAVVAAASAVAVAEAPYDQAALKRWVHVHPVVRIAVDPQQGAEIRGGQTNPLVTQYLALASRNTGIRFETVRTSSWEASVKAFLDRRVDLLPSTSDRLLASDVGSRALQSSPFYVGRTVIVTRSVGPADMDMWHLQGHTVAFKGGGAYESWLRREHPKIARLPLGDLQQVLAAVESGIADAAVGVDVAYHPIVRRDYALSLRIAGDVPEMPVTVRVAVQPDEPELLALIENSLRGLSPGENEAVIDRWLETAYLRAPTLSQVVSAYRVELGLGIALVLAMIFALWQLHRARQASRRGEQQKTMLLAVMSHEVRNAVNAVSSSIDLMARQPMHGPQRDLMAIAQVSSRHLQDLLSSALDYTRNESQGFTPDPVACDVLAVAREVVETQRPAIDAKGLDVRLELPMGPLPWLLIDETRLRQLIANLFANAVKFTRKGHVGIALWQGSEQSEDGVRRLVVEVFDTGIGVPLARQGELFKPFAQPHDGLGMRLGGTGLGLTICRDIATHLGGRLEFASESGVGTAVRVELPTSLVPPGPAAPGASETPGGEAHEEARGGSVLLVEDHPANRQIIAAQLAFLGYAAVAVEQGRTAIDRFVPGQFVGVLLDCELPDMQGYDVAAAMRAMEAAEGALPTRMIAISANQGEEHLRRCADCGIDTVLGKPLSLEALKSGLGRPSRTVEATFNEESLRDLMAIRTALDAGDVARALHSTHRLKGAALICEMFAIVDLAAALEVAVDATEPDRDEVAALLDAIETRLT